MSPSHPWVLPEQWDTKTWRSCPVRRTKSRSTSGKTWCCFSRSWSTKSKWRRGKRKRSHCLLGLFASFSPALIVLSARQCSNLMTPSECVHGAHRTPSPEAHCWVRSGGQGSPSGEASAADVDERIQGERDIERKCFTSYCQSRTPQTTLSRLRCRARWSW